MLLEWPDKAGVTTEQAFRQIPSSAHHCLLLQEDIGVGCRFG